MSFFEEIKKKKSELKKFGIEPLEFPGFAVLLLQHSLRADCDHGHMDVASGSEKLNQYIGA